MMKRLVGVIAILAAVGCADSTGPSASIKVRVLDDAGLPVYRTQVTLTFDGLAPVSTLTSKKGTASFAISQSGSYEVRVIPRAGYLGSTGPITKTVSVGANESSSVDFTIYREGGAPF